MGYNNIIPHSIRIRIIKACPVPWGTIIAGIRITTGIKTKSRSTATIRSQTTKRHIYSLLLGIDCIQFSTVLKGWLDTEKLEEHLLSPVIEFFPVLFRKYDIRIIHVCLNNSVLKFSQLSNLYGVRDVWNTKRKQLVEYSTTVSLWSLPNAFEQH